MYLESRRAFIRVMCYCYRPGLTIPALYVVDCILVIETFLLKWRGEGRRRRNKKESVVFSLSSFLQAKILYISTHCQIYSLPLSHSSNLQYLVHDHHDDLHRAALVSLHPESVSQNVLAIPFQLGIGKIRPPLQP